MAQPPSRVKLAYPSTSTSTGVPAATSHKAGMLFGVVMRIGGRGGAAPAARRRQRFLLRKRPPK
jgi:hypothetical protein